MHKKMEAELIDLAKRVLEDEPSNSIDDLQAKALAIYEKLTILKFVETNLGNSQNVTKKLISVKEETVVTETVTEEKIEETSSEKISFNEEINELNEEKIEETTLLFSFEDEFNGVSLSETETDLFEKVTITKETSELKENIETKKRSLNDALFKSNLQIGLNDRIAFVKYLFNGNQADFNRVLSQLNSFNTEDEAKLFLLEIVKPDYDWSGSEDYEQRLISLVERKFL